MKLRHLRLAALLTGLLLGQWLVLAHVSQHPALTANDHSCQICLHAQGLDSGAAPTLATLASLPIAQEAPSATGITFTPTLGASYYPIRGPPLLA